MTNTEDGLCACGCGEQTKIAKRTYTYGGTTIRKGEHYRYLPNHHRRLSPVEYVVDETRGCWLWQRALSHDGYAVCGTRIPGRSAYAHVRTYEDLVGPVPEGLQLDHVCRIRHCVNPAHLEPVTDSENKRRGSQGVLKTHCKHGHPWVEANVYVQPSTGKRSCKICRGRVYT